MIYVTLNKIREHRPCEAGWKKLLSHLGKTKADDEPLPLITVLESNDLEDALWCCRTLPAYDREWRLFAVWCARQVQHLMTDQRSIDAVDVAERYAHGDATDAELGAARAAAWDYAHGDATDAELGAARAVAWDAAWDTAGAAARAAARAAAGDAAGDAAWVAAWAAAWAAAGAAARAAAWAIIEAEFRRILSAGGTTRNLGAH
jgi:hypothetical protein